MKNIYSIPTILMLLFSVALFGQFRVEAPALRAPEDTEAGQNPNVMLNWDAVTGQTLDITYEAQVSTMEDFSDAVTYPRTDLSAQETGELTFGKTYFWRVKAFDGGEPSEWSEVWSFRVLESVTITAPSIGDEVYVNPIIEWDEVTGILEYQLQIDTTYVWNSVVSNTDETVNATFVLDENNMWTVGTGGLIQYFDGTSWATLDAGISEDLLSAYFLSSTSGFIVGNGGTIVQLDGTTWTVLEPITETNLTGVSFADADHGWAVGEDGTILKYVAGTWEVDDTNEDTEDLYSVFALTSSDVWACGKKKTILHFDGSSWTKEEVGLVDLYSIWFNDANNGWTVGKSGKINYYNGTEWTDQPTGTTKHLYGVSMSGNSGYAVGRDGAMTVYEDGQWKVVTSGVSLDLNGIWLNGDLGLAGGIEGSVIAKSGSGFDSPFEQIYQITKDTTEFQLELLPFGKNIYYRMRTFHSMDTSDWSSPRSMFTQAAPKLEKPNDGTEDADLLSLFSWKEYEGAVDYIYQIDDDMNFGSAFETFVDSTSIEYLMNLFDKEYYWRVKAQHPLDVSDWSDVRVIRTASTVELTSPDDGETEVSACPKYEWEEITGSKSYQIMVDTDEDFSDPMVDETDIASYQCLSPLPKKTTYFWKVRAISTLDTSDFSPVWSFQTEGFIGIEDEFLAESVEVYPNPNNGVFTVHLNSLTQEDYQITINDLTGRTIVNENVRFNSGDNLREYRLTDLEKGIYLMTLNKGEASVTKKIFIK